MRLLAAFVVLVAGVATASADDAARARLETHTDGACSLDDLRSHVEALLGRDPFSDDAPRTISVTAVHRDGVIEATLAGEHASRTITATSCEELSRSVAVVLVLVLRAGFEPAPVVPPAITIDEVPPALERPPGTASPGIDGDLLAGAAGGGSAHLGFAAIVGARLRRSTASLGIEAHLQPSQQQAVGDDAGLIDVTTRSFAVTPCLHRGRFVACALLAGGWVRGRGERLIDARSATTPLVAVGGRLAWEQPIAGPVSLRVHVDARALVTESRFQVDEMTVWETGRFDAWVGAGLVAQMP